MRKLIILAISAILVANVSAQEAKRECQGKQLTKEERVEMDIKRFTHELMLSDKQAEKFAVTFREYSAKMDELFEKGKPEKFEPGKELTDDDLDKLAKNRFEGQKKFAELQEKFYAKFRKDLSARQVAKVLRLEPCGKQEAFGPGKCSGKFDGKACGKPDCKGQGKCDGKHDGKQCKHDGKQCKHNHPHGPRPEARPDARTEASKLE